MFGSCSLDNWSDLIGKAAFLPETWKEKKVAKDDKVEDMHNYNLKTVQISVTDESLIPTYAKEGDAGADLRSSIDAVIKPGQRMLVGTGVTLALEPGLVGLVHPRSGLALKYGITVLNTPGTIDSGYRGEVGVILLNTSDEPFDIRRGDRIAQLVIQSYYKVDFVNAPIDELPSSDRGEGGFGSTGVNG